MTNRNLWQLLWTFGSRLCVVGLTAVFGIVSARILGPEDKGVYTLITLAPVITSTLAMLAGPQLVLIDVSGLGRSTLRVRRLLRWSLAVAIVSSTVVLGFYWFFQETKSVPFIVLVLAIVVGALPLVVFEYLAALIQGQKRFKTLAILRVVQVLLPGIGMLLGARIGVSEAIIGFTMGGLLLGLGSAIMWSVQSCTVTVSELPEKVHIPWSFVLPTNVSLLILFLSYRADIVLMGVLSTSEQIGLYSSGVALAELILLGSLSLTVVLSPGYAKDMNRPIRRGLLSVTVFSLCAGGGVYLVAPWIVPFAFGIEYAGAILPVQILSVGVVFLSVYRFLVSVEIVRNQRQSVLISSSTILLANLALLFLLAPNHGAVGAAIAASGAYALGTMVLLGSLLHRSRRLSRLGAA